MRVKKIQYINGQASDFIKITDVDGEITYIDVDSIISVTVKTDGDIKIICVHNEQFFLKDVDKDQLELLLEYGNYYDRDSEDESEDYYN